MLVTPDVVIYIILPFSFEMELNLLKKYRCKVILLIVNLLCDKSVNIVLSQNL